ncbi:MAG: DUF3293 domain-containing protein [Candidatus Accumulibacter sp. UW26]|jgi:hypothetical protein
MSRATLAAAFQATTYRVETPEGIFSLRIGTLDPVFDAFLLRHAVAAAPPAGAVGWAIVTAHNPGGLLGEDENRLRQKRLRQRILTAGWHFLPACNVADVVGWPLEPSFLLLPADEEQSRALAAEFGQLAVVFGRTGSAPQLLWL